MIDAIIAASIRRRGLVFAGAILLAVAGLAAVRSAPVDAIPDLSEDQVIVFADWPGHAPPEVEARVTSPLAAELRGIPGVRAIRSSSDFNFATWTLVLDDGSNLARGQVAVAERLARSAGTLPPGVTPRLGPDAAPTGQIYWYTVRGGGLDLGRLRTVQDEVIRPRLAAVAGVAEVASVGGFPVEYEVAVLPDRMRSRGVTLAEIIDAVARSNTSVGGQAIHKANAEYLVRGVALLGPDAVDELRKVVLPNHDGAITRLSDVARVAIVPGPRRGVLEMDGDEVVGGVVVMASGANPREVTRRVRAAIAGLSAELPSGVAIRPFYDRTPLIDGAISTVTSAVIEAILTATICIVVVLLHVRASFVVAITLPLAALGSFAIMAALRWLGIADIQANLMSISGIAISIGVLVDSSIVMTENAMHRLREHFGDRPATGDLRPIVLPACLAVGRPIVFSVAIMVLSFLPVFALGGMEGKMFRPLAATKTFALLTVAALSITLVPALCTVLLRGRLRGERANPIVRGAIDVYRPVLASLLDDPAPLAWVLGVTFVVALTPIGSRWVTLPVLFAAIVACGTMFRSRSRARPRDRLPRPRRPRRRAVDHADGPRIPRAAGRGDGHGYADHRPPRRRGPGGGRPQGPRHGFVPLPRGRYGRRQGRKGRPRRPTRLRST